MKQFLWRDGALKTITEQSFPNGVLPNDYTLPLDVTTLYNQVAWFRQSVKLIAQAATALPRTLHAGKDADAPQLNESELNVDLDLDTNLDAFVGDLVLYGAAYGYLLRNKFKIVKKLVRWSPRTIEPQYNVTSGLVGFRRRVGTHTLDLQPNEIFYLWEANREAEVGPGVANAAAAQKAAAALLNLNRHVEEYFKHGAINPTIITAPGMLPQGREELKSWYQRLFGRGIKSSNSVAVVEDREIKIQSFGTAPRDLAAEELTRIQRQEVAAALGIPQALLFSEAANYATAMSDQLLFYDLTVVPLVKRLTAALNQQVLHGLDLHLELHHEQMEIYQRSAYEKAASMLGLYQAGVMTADEIRADLGLAALVSDRPPTATNAATVSDESAAQQQDDLRKLGTVATKRLKEGRLDKVDGFESAHLTPPHLRRIKADLKSCESEADIRRVIERETAWVEYG